MVSVDEIIDSKNLKLFIIGVTIVLFIILITVCIYRRDGFSSKKERAGHIYSKVKKLTKDGDFPTYKEYSTAIPRSDAVEYMDVNSLYRKGKLNSNNIENIII